MNINPQKIHFYIPAEIVMKKYGHPRFLNGLAINDAELLQHKVSIFAEPKIKYCVDHFVDGISWKDLPIEDAPMERYFQLDCLFKKVKQTGFFKDIPGDNVLIHMINGEPYFAGGGYHRLAIALIQGLRSIPVDVSLICTAKGGES